MLVSSPRAWGCFPVMKKNSGKQAVFPTCVGVFLVMISVLGVRSNLPHVRGGVSKMAMSSTPRGESSPRAWGCFLQQTIAARHRSVFPTCVGVFLSIYEKIAISWRLPHMRGSLVTAYLTQTHQCVTLWSLTYVNVFDISFSQLRPI